MSLDKVSAKVFLTPVIKLKVNVIVTMFYPPTVYIRIERDFVQEFLQR